MTIDDGAVYRGEALSGAAGAGGDASGDEERAYPGTAPAVGSGEEAGALTDPPDLTQGEDRG